MKSDPLNIFCNSKATEVQAATPTYLATQVLANKGMDGDWTELFHWILVVFLRNQDPSNPINPHSLFKSTVEELVSLDISSQYAASSTHTDTHQRKK